MSRRSRRKGCAGELQVVRLLTAWWCEFEPALPDGRAVRFARTPSSGGWQHGPGFNACGDVMTNSYRFPFSVEVKRAEAWSLQNLLDGRACPVWGFWRQCQTDAAKVGKEPLLWFRQNRRPWMVMMRARYASSVRGLAPPQVVWTRELCRRVECWELPVLYLAGRVLDHAPEIFAV